MIRKILSLLLLSVAMPHELDGHIWFLGTGTIAYHRISSYDSQTKFKDRWLKISPRLYMEHNAQQRPHRSNTSLPHREAALSWRRLFTLD